jgi:RNA polymerase sigma-70 factor (ECF subfamily)
MDRESFAALYREHVGRVTGFAARRLAGPGEVADLVAASFLVALERTGSYDPDKGDPGGSWPAPASTSVPSCHPTTSKPSFGSRGR